MFCTGADSVIATEKTVDKGMLVTVTDSLVGGIKVGVTEPPISHAGDD
jgi:hypothetical protein